MMNGGFEVLEETDMGRFMVAVNAFNSADFDVKAEWLYLIAHGSNNG